MQETVLSYAQYCKRITRIFIVFCIGLVLFLLVMALGETLGGSRQALGVIFLFSAIGLFAVVGIYCRTSNMQEYYVAGRRVPAVFNGMASAADWMSAATFLSLAGGLYLQGFSGSNGQPGGLAYILGWTGGFCILALWVAPELRHLELLTLPDFFQNRYGGYWPRVLAAWGTILCSFTYLVAQIYGVGLIASYLTEVPFAIGVMLGLGGVLVCSFLGGMRAITWTQVAQYVILLMAFLLPVSWLSYKQLEGTATSALAPLAYGQKMATLAALEEQLQQDPREREVRAEYALRAKALREKLADVEAALTTQRERAENQLYTLRTQGADMTKLQAAQRAYQDLPKDLASARQRWRDEYENYQIRSLPLGGIPPQAQAFVGENPDEVSLARLNFFALIICLMAGTAGLPHILTRYYTTPSVACARSSVAWTLLFVGALYISVPAMAVLVKFEVMQNLVGSDFSNLPDWVQQWSRVDNSLLNFADVNGDGILQFAELHVSPDVVMLLSPELAGLPYVISGLVATGGLAAALSTADGLLLTLGNALAHDLRGRKQKATVAHRHDQQVLASKLTLLVVAIVAAAVASLQPSDILNLVSASFSFAAAIFVPTMLFGLYSQRIGSKCATLAMLAGFGITLFYMLAHSPVAQRYIGYDAAPALWFGIQPISAGVFGLGLGLTCLFLSHVFLRVKTRYLPIARSSGCDT